MKREPSTRRKFLPQCHPLAGDKVVNQGDLQNEGWLRGNNVAIPVAAGGFECLEHGEKLPQIACVSWGSIQVFLNGWVLDLPH